MPGHLSDQISEPGTGREAANSPTTWLSCPLSPGYNPVVRCPRCQHENRDAAKFCAECAAPLARTCASCGVELQPAAKFCDECAVPVAAAKPAAGTTTPATPERDPRAYTPKHLADKILQSKSALEGERKQVTVLFADVKGSMELAEQVDPEEWHAILDRFFRILTDGVHRFEGTINQYTGDGIMALFGAPITHEDHAQRACYAALHLRDALRRYANELRFECGLNFFVRMGLNSGDVIVGTIGDDLRMDYTAQGHTVGLAARMEQLAEPGSIYLAEHTGQLVAGYFDTEDLGKIKVPGVREKMSISELKGAGAVRTRFDVSRARGLTRFIGRDADMETLAAALDRARQGGGQVVGVVGEAGVGKSRLCFEFAERCRAEGLLVLEGHALAHGKNVPFLPVLQIFRAYFGIMEHDDERTAREKIAGRLLLLDDDFREVLPLVFDFLGVPDPARPAPRMDAEARQRQLFATVGRLVETGNQGAGFLLFIEDLHWIDRGSDAFVAQWAEAIAGARGVLLVNFRPEYRADWMQKSYYHQLPLLPLGAEAIRELVADLLGSDPSVAALAGTIQDRTAGNPFFTEEVVQSLIESGTLTGSRGSYRLMVPVESLQVPETVQSILAARIDRLAEREKALLQTAAVIGREFIEPILEAVASLPKSELAAALETLKSAEFLSQRALYPVAEYAFKHRLTQEVALGSQLHERLRRTHSTIARAMETIHADRLDEQAALLAHHWEEADEPLEAARWHARAAEWLGMRDVTEAVRHWQRVRELGATLPDEREVATLRLLACARLLPLGGWRLGLSQDDVEALYAEARQLAEVVGDAAVRARLAFAYALQQSSAGHIQEGLALAVEAARLADSSGDHLARCEARMGLAVSYASAGRLPGALAIAEEGMELMDGDVTIGTATGGASYFVYLHQLRHALRAWMGRFGEIREGIAESLQLGHENKETEVQIASLAVYTYLADFSGERTFPGVGDVRNAAARAAQTADKLGSALAQGLSYSALGLAHLLHDEWREAQRWLEASLHIVRQHHTGVASEALTLERMARALLGAGESARARAAVEEAIALGASREQLHYEAAAQITLARILSATEGSAGRAAIEMALDRARDLVEASGAGALEAPIAEQRAELARLLGGADAYRRELNEAHRLYVAIGATGHAERVGKELA